MGRSIGQAALVCQGKKDTTTAIITRKADIARMADRVNHLSSGLNTEVAATGDKIAPRELQW